MITEFYLMLVLLFGGADIAPEKNDNGTVVVNSGGGGCPGGVCEND